MEIKLIVTDIDGTLVDQTEYLPTELTKLVNQCQDNGLHFTVATGRTKELTMEIVRALGITSPYVAANGACIYEGDHCISSHGLGALPILEILREADKEGLTVTFSAEGKEQAIRQTAYVREHQRIGKRFQTYLSLDRTDWENQLFQKIMIMDENRTGRIKKYQEMMKNNQEKYWVTSYSDMAVELGPGGCNKATGVKELAGLLGLDMKQVLACGDFLNDLEMIEEAGVGVAVANGVKELKERADYVAQREYCFGVIEAVERYCFPKGGRR